MYWRCSGDSHPFHCSLDQAASNDTTMLLPLEQSIPVVQTAVGIPLSLQAYGWVLPFGDVHQGPGCTGVH